MVIKIDFDKVTIIKIMIDINYSNKNDYKTILIFE